MACALAAGGVVLAGVAIAADGTGFGRVSGPAAIGALGALLLAFTVANWSDAADQPNFWQSSGGGGPGGADGD